MRLIGKVIEINPSPEQITQIVRNFGCCRFIWNWALQERIFLYRTTKHSLRAPILKADLVSLKKEYPWLKEADSTSLQFVIENLETAYKRFFKHISGFPRFKKKKEGNSYTAKNTNNSVIIAQRQHIKIPKLGLVKLKQKVNKKLKIHKATIFRKGSKFFVSILYENNAPVKKKVKSGLEVGIDLGIKNFATLSNGEVIENPKFYQKNHKKTRKLQRQLTKKQKGSKNYRKQSIKLTNQEAHVANIRKDFLNKVTTSIAKRFDYIALEDLNVKGMMENHCLARAVQDLGWYRFRLMLEYKTQWYGSTLRLIGRFEPSSQICSQCGFRNTGTKDLSVREWTCPKCGAHHDRDVNAAKNILEFSRLPMERGEVTTVDCGTAGCHPIDSSCVTGLALSQNQSSKISEKSKRTLLKKAGESLPFSPLGE